ncbi:MAG TPA: glycogen-binding domain-containing protein, partial [Longimicrobium sp.]|nr:glycogen-binding domain-containing protein [Longimicrobium sp.]
MRAILSSALPMAGALALLAAPAAAQVVVRLHVPPATPADAAVYVAGSFNNWNPADPAFRLTKDASGDYVLTVPEAPPGPVEFKFTLGSWETVETDASGAGVPNRAWTIPDGPSAWE